MNTYLYLMSLKNLERCLVIITAPDSKSAINKLKERYSLTEHEMAKVALLAPLEGTYDLDLLRVE